ncbi:hypothetical protein QQG55_14875 [Brugia pahangi]
MSTWERSAEACRNAPDMMLTCLSYPIYQTLDLGRCGMMGSTGIEMRKSQITRIQLANNSSITDIMDRRSVS